MHDPQMTGHTFPEKHGITFSYLFSSGCESMMQKKFTFQLEDIIGSVFRIQNGASRDVDNLLRRDLWALEPRFEIVWDSYTLRTCQRFECRIIHDETY